MAIGAEANAAGVDHCAVVEKSVAVYVQHILRKNIFWFFFLDSQVEIFVHVVIEGLYDKNSNVLNLEALEHIVVLDKDVFYNFLAEVGIFLQRIADQNQFFCALVKVLKVL